jgi:hypothetical protein
MLVILKDIKETIPITDYDRSETTGDVEYFNCLNSIITNNARCTREIKSRIAMAKAAFNRKIFFTRNWI